MAWADRDGAVRAAAFAWIAEQVRRHGSDVLPRALLAEGFRFEGTRIPLIGPQGIFKPAALTGLPLSILTVPRVEGREPPYRDGFTGDELTYRYRGSPPEPSHPDNVGLRRAMREQVPLVYFYGLVLGRYLAVWPVYVVGDDTTEGVFTIQPDEPTVLQPGLVLDSSDDLRRAYALRTVRQRIHQHRFRERVLRAYQMTCAVCRLRHDELLDAAHILPDGLPRRGPPGCARGDRWSDAPSWSPGCPQPAYRG